MIDNVVLTKPTPPAKTNLMNIILFELTRITSENYGDNNNVVLPTPALPANTMMIILM